MEPMPEPMEWMLKKVKIGVDSTCGSYIVDIIERGTKGQHGGRARPTRYSKPEPAPLNHLNQAEVRIRYRSDAEEALSFIRTFITE